MDVLGVVYLMKRSEWVVAAWCLGSWWCVLWIRNKLPLSNMPSSTRYNGSTGFGRYSPLGGAAKGVQEVHLICRLGYCRVAQSIGLVNTGPDQVSEPKEVEYFTQRTSTDARGRYTGLYVRRGFKDTCFAWSPLTPSTCRVVRCTPVEAGQRHRPSTSASSSGTPNI
jgi:hypothetical protein